MAQEGSGTPKRHQGLNEEPDYTIVNGDLASASSLALATLTLLATSLALFWSKGNKQRQNLRIHHRLGRIILLTFSLNEK